MQFLSSRQYLAASPQIGTPFEPLQVTLPGVRVRIFLLNNHLQCLGQKPRDRSLALDGKQLDFEQSLFGNRECDIPSFHFPPPREIV
jgi:hypothetical protein